jgi:hypothetical protein
MKMSTLGKTMSDAEQRKQWLDDYVRERMTPLEFAQRIQRTRALVYGILAGKYWTDIPRPPEFHYPWTDEEYKECGKVRPQIAEYTWKLECLQDYVKDRMTPKQFSEHVGLSLGRVYMVLKGKIWTDIPRPVGFQYPWSPEV